VIPSYLVFINATLPNANIADIFTQSFHITDIAINDGVLHYQGFGNTEIDCKERE
jgi:hypothetical protein